jgi:hypothetical protein
MNMAARGTLKVEKSARTALTAKKMRTETDSGCYGMKPYYDSCGYFSSGYSDEAYWGRKQGQR